MDLSADPIEIVGCRDVTSTPLDFMRWFLDSPPKTPFAIHSHCACKYAVCLACWTSWCNMSRIDLRDTSSNLLCREFSCYMCKETTQAHVETCTDDEAQCLICVDSLQRTYPSAIKALTRFCAGYDDGTFAPPSVPVYVLEQGCDHILPATTNIPAGGRANGVFHMPRFCHHCVCLCLHTPRPTTEPFDVYTPRCYTTEYCILRYTPRHMFYSTDTCSGCGMAVATRDEAATATDHLAHLNATKERESELPRVRDLNPYMARAPRVRPRIMAFATRGFLPTLSQATMSSAPPGEIFANILNQLNGQSASGASTTGGEITLDGGTVTEARNADANEEADASSTTTEASTSTDDMPPNPFISALMGSLSGLGTASSTTNPSNLVSIALDALSSPHGHNRDRDRDRDRRLYAGSHIEFSGPITIHLDNVQVNPHTLQHNYSPESP